MSQWSYFPLPACLDGPQTPLHNMAVIGRLRDVLHAFLTHPRSRDRHLNLIMQIKCSKDLWIWLCKWDGQNHGKTLPFWWHGQSPTTLNSSKVTNMKICCMVRVSVGMVHPDVLVTVADERFIVTHRTIKSQRKSLTWDRWGQSLSVCLSLASDSSETIGHHHQTWHGNCLGHGNASCVDYIDLDSRSHRS